MVVWLPDDLPFICCPGQIEYIKRWVCYWKRFCNLFLYLVSQSYSKLGLGTVQGSTADGKRRKRQYDWVLLACVPFPNLLELSTEYVLYTSNIVRLRAVQVLLHQWCLKIPSLPINAYL